MRHLFSSEIAQISGAHHHHHHYRDVDANYTASVTGNHGSHQGFVVGNALGQVKDFVDSFNLSHDIHKEVNAVNAWKKEVEHPLSGINTMKHAVHNWVFHVHHLF